MSDPEPRRSVRSTKGQHKALDLEQRSGPKKRGRKGKKSEEKQESPEEEVIRCACGATEQDEDSGEPWIACDGCGAWQHNVCMGMSVYGEDLLKEYFCERCHPEDHRALLDSIAKGEKIWEERRRQYEEEKLNEKKKKGGKKGKAKRNSDPQDDQASKKAKVSPAPEPKKETKAATGAKRKSRGASEEKDGKATQKMRKLSETQSVAVPAAYEAPQDIAAKITELGDSRQTVAKALLKSLNVAIGVAEKKHGFVAADGISNETRAEQLAIQIERSVHDTHPNLKEYGTQIKTLLFNLKTNPELCNRLLNKSLTPPMLAVMTTDEMASKQLKHQKAEMKARAEKQAILVTEDGPRLRRTHKGEEMVDMGNDSFAVPSERNAKGSLLRRQGAREAEAAKVLQDHAAPAGGDSHTSAELPVDLELRQSPPKDALHIDTQASPKTDFDINKVFSSVRSPTAAHHRRPSQPLPPARGPGVDPEVDRLLQDDREDSPPYSPSEETDPSVIWRGNVIMNSVANLQATAKHVGGVNLQSTIHLPWASLIPKRLTVAGRIDETKATEYLCSLRYSAPTDITVIGLSPATEAAKPDYFALINYFLSKKRYGVVGDKGVGNVRDTYLIPVPPGAGSYPEFMLNLEDNFIPATRTEPLLLVVIVYKNDPAAMEKLHGPHWTGQSHATQSPAIAATPTPGPQGLAQRVPSISAPAFSPASPQGAFPNANYPSQRPAQQQSPHTPGPGSAFPAPAPQSTPNEAEMKRLVLQQEGEAEARQILQGFLGCATITFIMPQAYRMKSEEWHLIKDIYEREPRARDDLQCLSLMIENASKAAQAQQQAAQQGQMQTLPPKTSTTPVPIPQVPHTVFSPPRPPPPNAHPAAAPPAAAPPA